MKTFKGPYYTLDEACEKLKWHRSELLHAIDNEKIEPLVFNKHAKLMVITPGQDGTWAGHAVITYRGHLKIPKRMYIALLDGSKKHLGPEWGLIVDQAGIEHVSTEYPLDAALPIGKLKSWEPSATKLTNWPVVNLPIAAADIREMLQYAGEKFSSIEVNEHLQIPKNTILSFSSKKPYRIEDLRISESEILGLSEQVVSENPPNEAAPRDAAVLTHTRQIHEVFERLLRAHPNIPAKECWRILRNDHNLEDPILDLDYIVNSMDGSEILWTSKNGVSQTLGWSSFGSVLSRIKLKIRDEK